MSPEEIRALYDYNAWANRRKLDDAAKLTNEQFGKPLGSSFSSIRETLAHMCGAEAIWHERFEGHSPENMPDLSHLHTVDALRSHWSAQEEKLLAYVRKLTQADLNRTLEYKTFKFGAYSNPLWQSLQHVVNHGTYHRGQITTMLRQLGATPTLTDLMHYYRERANAASA